jgi:hypothetical protein
MGLALLPLLKTRGSPCAEIRKLCCTGKACMYIMRWILFLIATERRHHHHMLASMGFTPLHVEV